jgi:hypothetical protein
MLNVDTITSQMNINQNIIINTLNDQALSISNGTNIFQR